jgi:hypothetical protein
MVSLYDAGNVISPEKVDKSTIVKARKPKIRAAYTNDFPLAGHIKDVSRKNCDLYPVRI